MTLFVARTDLGRGVFSDRSIAAGELVERAPVVVVPQAEIADVSRTALYDYWFAWGPDDRDGALALGFGSLYNHAADPNVVYTKDFASQTLAFIATRPIVAGEELRVDYTGGGDPTAPLWFAPDNRRNARLPHDALASVSAVAVVSLADGGRGVVARRAVAAGETIEIAPAIVVPAEDRTHLERTAVAPACVAWGEACAFALGCVSAYRPADNPSARLERDATTQTLRVVALQSVAAGAEITLERAPAALVRVGSSAAGQGVFAAQHLAAGTVACRFAGPIVTAAEVPDDEVRHALWLDTTRWLIPGAPARFINHSCAPNCTLEDDPDDGDAALVVTTRPVDAGEELSIAYDLMDADLLAAHAGDPDYAWHSAWTFDCRCGAPRCRGRIDRYSPRFATQESAS